MGLLALLFALAPVAQGQGDLREKKELLPAPIRHFLFFEQERIDRGVNTERLMAPTVHADTRYNPDSGNVFEVDSYWLDSTAVFSARGLGLEPRLRELFFREHEGRPQVRLLVHPESRKFYEKVTAGLEVADKFYATATSSSRSCVVWKEGIAPFMVKMSLDLNLGGVDRKIPASEVSRSIGTNDVIETDRANLPADFETFPEVISVIPQGQGMKRGGMIVRQFPRDLVEGRANYIPIFALYALPPGQGPPLLAEMIRKSGKPALQFIRERLLKPFARQWLELTIFHGISMEPHGQNMLAKVDSDDMPVTGFGHRDMGGFDIAFPYRKALGMKAPAEPLPTITDFAQEYHQAVTNGEPEYEGALGRSIYTHFESGIIFNVDKYIAGWAKKGWIPNEPGLAEGPLAKMLKAELESAYLEMTGIKIQLTHTAELKDHVVRARKTLTAFAPFLAPKIAQGDYAAARELLAAASAFRPRTLAYLARLSASDSLEAAVAQGLRLPRPADLSALDALVAGNSPAWNRALFTVFGISSADQQALAERMAGTRRFETEARFSDFFEAHFAGLADKSMVLKSKELDVLPWVEARFQEAGTLEDFRTADARAVADFGKRPELLKVLAERAKAFAPLPAETTVNGTIEYLSLRPSLSDRELGQLLTRSLFRARSASEVVSLAMATVPKTYGKDQAQTALWDPRIVQMRQRLFELTPTAAEKGQFKKLLNGSYGFFCLRNLVPILSGTSLAR